MKAAVEKDTTTRVISIRVVDGPILDITQDWHRKIRNIQVQSVTIRVVNGETRHVKVAGGMVLVSGATSTAQYGEKSWGLYQDAIGSSSPDWVQKLWREAPAGVTEWKL